MAFWKSPCMLDRGWAAASESGIVGPIEQRRIYWQECCWRTTRVELFAFRFSSCLDKQNSLFLLRPEWAEPQGWKVKREHKRKFFLKLDFCVLLTSLQNFLCPYWYFFPSCSLKDSSLELNCILSSSNAVSILFLTLSIFFFFLFSEIFPDQGLNRRLLHWQADSLPLSHQGSPSTLFFVFSKTKLQQPQKHKNWIDLPPE